jgi:hypothetical protein
MPRLLAEALANETKLVVAIVTVGVPNLSMLSVSWIHHEVHPPQSAEAQIIKSACFAINSISFIELP